jgi:hypothetical protein
MCVAHATQLPQAESFVSSCYAGTGLYYRGDSAGVEVCVRDCDPASKFHSLVDRQRFLHFENTI